MLIALFRMLFGILSAFMVMKLFGAFARVISGRGAHSKAQQAKQQGPRGFGFKDDEVLDVAAREVDAKQGQRSSID